jgi:hypothetical protein
MSMWYYSNLSIINPSNMSNYLNFDPSDALIRTFKEAKMSESGLDCTMNSRDILEFRVYN